MSGRAARALTGLRRWLRPPRTLHPTRAGWSYFLFVLGVGFAALNTGNNLLYLVFALMLAFLVLSGVLSESALRGLAVRRRLPAEVFAGTPATVLLEIRNDQRRVPAFAVVAEDLAADPEAAGGARGVGRAFLLRIGPGETGVRGYTLRVAERGWLPLRGVRVSTRFPFGLFVKARVLPLPGRALVYPEIAAGTRVAPPAVAEPGARASARARGAEDEVSGVRRFSPGDPMRRVHWRASLRRGQLLVREQSGAAGGRAELRLETRGVRPGAGFEGSVKRVASEALALLDAGVRVGLRLGARKLPHGEGPHQRARLLRALALAAPEAP